MLKLCSYFVIACLLSLALPSHAITQEKERDIQRLMELLDVSAMSGTMADLMVPAIIAQERKQIPNMPADAENAISTVVRKVTLELAPELFNAAIPLYDKYYTHSEIAELIEFFESPIGRKYSAAVQPITQDIIRIAKNWGRKVGPIAAQEVEKELIRLGYK